MPMSPRTYTLVPYTSRFRAGFAGPGRADLHELACAIVVQHSVDRGEVIGGQGGVEQTAELPLHERVAGAQDVDTDEERDDRVEHLPVEDRHERYPDENTRGGPHIGQEVLAVSEQRDRSVRPSCPDAGNADAEVEHRRASRQPEAEPNLFERRGGQQAKMGKT